MTEVTGWASLGEVSDEPVEQAGPMTTADFVYVDIGSIDRDRKAIATAQTVPVGNAPSRAKQRLRTGDVLVSMTRPNLNAVAIVPASLEGAIGSTGFHVLRSKYMVPQYLYFLVQSQQFVDAMCAVVQGALYPAVRPSDINAFGMRIPSRIEQTRIVDKLEELLSDLDAGVAELKAAQKKLAQYRQSLLKAAVEGRLTEAWRAQHGNTSANEESGSQLLTRILGERRACWEAKQLAKFEAQGKAPVKGWQDKYPEPMRPKASGLPALPASWTWTTVDELSPDDLANGRSVPTAAAGAKVLRLNALKSGAVDLTKFKLGAWSEGEAKQFAVADGDLLIARGNGSLKLVGRAGLVAGVSEQVAYPDTMIRLRLVELVVRPAWIGLLWDSARTRSHIEQQARTSAGIYKISQPDIVSVVVPVPPLAEQDHLLAEIAREVEQIVRTEQSIETALHQSAAQRKNILQAAFSGQLVPQDPDDEPASVLLARIRAERASQPAKLRKPRALG